MSHNFLYDDELFSCQIKSIVIMMRNISQLVNGPTLDVAAR